MAGMCGALMHAYLLLTDLAKYNTQNIPKHSSMKLYICQAQQPRFFDCPNLLEVSNTIYFTNVGF